MYRARCMNGEDPIGKWIDVNGHKFEIIGVMKRPGASVPGQDDTRVYAAVFHHAQDVPGVQGEHAGGRMPSPAGWPPPSTRPAP